MQTVSVNLQPNPGASEVEAHQPPTGITTAARVVNVVDGDTIDVEIVRRVRVRLCDCWAPESRTRNLEEKAAGLASTDYMRRVCPVGMPVTLFIPAAAGGVLEKAFSMGRVLGYLWVNDGDARDVSQRMRDAGHATKTKAESPWGRK